MTIDMWIAGPHVCAALVALHAFAIIAMAFPAPCGGTGRRITRAA